MTNDKAGERPVGDWLATVMILYINTAVITCHIKLRRQQEASRQASHAALAYFVHAVCILYITCVHNVL